jgi:hypothetical protein
MPAPTTSLATLRPDLGGSLEEFPLAMDRQGFIGLEVLPVFEVPEQAGAFGRIPIEELLQNRDTERSPGSGYSRGRFKFTPDSYVTAEHGAEEVVDDKLARMYRNYFDAELIAAQRARDIGLRNHERRAAAALFNATTFAAQLTSISDEWDDAANADPIGDVETAARAIWARTGLWPNALIINRTVFRNLRLCEQIIERIASSGAGAPTRAADINVGHLRSVFDLDKILVAGSAKNTATEGQTVAVESIWSNEYAMVARVAMSQDIAEPCIGRTMHWGEDGSEIGAMIESYRSEEVRADVIRARHEVQNKILYVEAAQLLDNVTS